MEIRTEFSCEIWKYKNNRKEITLHNMSRIIIEDTTYVRRFVLKICSFKHAFKISQVKEQ